MSNEAEDEGPPESLSENLDNENDNVALKETSSEDASRKESSKQKIDILLKPTANAPIMKKRKWAIDADKPISWINDFIRKYLKLEPEETIFLYINQTFAPSPDQTVKNLYECYNTEGKLVLHYCKTQAWG